MTSRRDRRNPSFGRLFFVLGFVQTDPTMTYCRQFRGDELSSSIGRASSGAGKRCSDRWSSRVVNSPDVLSHIVGNFLRLFERCTRSKIETD